MDTVAQIDMFFAGRPRQWALFEAMRGALCSRWPETSLRVMKTCVSFDDPRPYLYVSLPPASISGGREGILVTFGLRRHQAHPRFAQVVRISGSRYTVHLPVFGEEEIDGELLGLVALSRAQCEKPRHASVDNRDKM